MEPPWNAGVLDISGLSLSARRRRWTFLPPSRAAARRWRVLEARLAGGVAAGAVNHCARGALMARFTTAVMRLAERHERKAWKRNLTPAAKAADRVTSHLRLAPNARQAVLPAYATACPA